MGTLRLAAAALLAAGLSVPATAGAAAPAPCGGTAHITDPTGDGHHAGTDVTSAWFAESATGVQAVIRPASGVWGSEHDDRETATWAMLFTVGTETRFVRFSGRTGTPGTYDTGTWTATGGFAATGITTGATEQGFDGTVVIDVPAALSGPIGTVLARPFVLTSDGFDGPGKPHWVDRAPGGTSPTEAAFGADFVVGTCTAEGSGTTAGGLPGAPGTGSGLTAVGLSTAPRRRGAGRQTVAGRITPARGGVAVRITATTTQGTARTHTTTTAADGRFSTTVPISETTRLRAVAEGLGSQTLTVTVVARVRIRVRRTRAGGAVVTGTVSPAISGRVIWLRTSAITPSARTTAKRGRFTFRLKRPVRGRYQAIFTPTGERAERATSNTGVIR